MQGTVYISLGTNLGDRLENLKEAVNAISTQVQSLETSPVYKTAPWGYTDQPEFLNQVIRGETRLSPLKLLSFLKEVEAQLGRQPSFRYGPRLIDMDILFYDGLVWESPDLAVPHPRLQERAFVLAPLADLAPDLRHPILNKTVRELLSELDTAGVEPYHASQQRE